MKNATYFILDIGQSAMMPPFRNIQHDSLPVGHRTRFYGMSFRKVGNITHKLLVIWEDPMRLLVRNHLLSVGHRTRPPSRKVCGFFTHNLWIIGNKVWVIKLPWNVAYFLLSKQWWGFLQEYMQCHLQTVDHSTTLPFGKLQYHSLPVECMTRNDDSAIWRNV